MADPKAEQIKTNTAAFDNVLSAADTDVQKALETLDENAGGGGAYTDADAVAAMGAKDDSNPLNHDRYTDAEAEAIADTQIATHAADADAHHDEAHTIASHSDTTATGAELETLTDGSDAETLHNHDADIAAHAAIAAAHHDKYTDAEAVLAMGAKSDANPLNHDKYTDTEAVSAMGAEADSNPLNHDRYTDLEAETVADTQIATHAADADAHHNESHDIASHNDTTATGAELETLTDGSDAGTLHIHDGRYYTESETADEIDADIATHAGLPDVHHAQAHTVASHSDTTATGAELETLTDGSDAGALHKHDTANDVIYERLDGTNQPATGNKETKKTAPTHTLTDDTNDSETAISKVDTDNKAERTNQVGGVADGNDSTTMGLWHFDSDFTDSAVGAATAHDFTSNLVTIDTGVKKFGTGSALHVDTSYLSTAAHTDFQFGTGACTIEGWVYVTSYSAVGSVFFSYGYDSGGGAVAGYLFYTDATGRLRFNSNSKIVTTASGVVVPLSTWTHVQFCRDASGNAYLFIAGDLKVTDATWGAEAIDGSGTTVNTGYFKGSGYDLDMLGNIDELRVSNTCKNTSSFTPRTTAYTSGALISRKVWSSDDDANTFGDDDLPGIVNGETVSSCISGSKVAGYDVSGNHEHYTTSPTRTLKETAGSRTSQSYRTATAAGRTGTGQSDGGNNTDVVSYAQFDSSLADDAEGGTPVTFTAGGGGPTYAAGKFGNALDCTGGEYVYVPNRSDFDFGSGEFSIDMFLYRNTSATLQRFFGNFSSTGDATGANIYGLIYATGEIRIYLVEDDGTIHTLTTTTQYLTTATWIHLVICRDGNTARLKVDGTQEVTLDITGVTLRTPSNQWAYGRAGEYTGGTWDGRVDNPRVKYGTCSDEYRGDGDYTVPTTAYTGITTPDVDIWELLENLLNVGDEDYHTALHGKTISLKVGTTESSKVNAAGVHEFYEGLKWTGMVSPSLDWTAWDGWTIGNFPFVLWNGNADNYYDRLSSGNLRMELSADVMRAAAYAIALAWKPLTTGDHGYFDCVTNTKGFKFRDAASADILFIDPADKSVLYSGPMKPATMTDAAAPNNSIYYSSDAAKLVYKDSGGTVNNLY